MQLPGRVGLFALLAAFAVGRAAAGTIFADCPAGAIPVQIDGQTTVSCSLTQTYTTEITARMQGGSLIFDQTFSVPFTDPLVQAAVVTAKGVLTGAGALFLTGPTLTSSQTTLLPDITTVIGPGTALIYNIGTCQGVTPHVDSLGDQLYTPFGCAPPGVCSGDPIPLLPNSYYPEAACPPTGGGTLLVAAGNININTNVDHQLAEVYEVDGFATVPEPSSLLLLGWSGLLLAMWRRQRPGPTTRACVLRPESRDALESLRSVSPKRGFYGT